jgi:hypothetical protein
MAEKILGPHDPRVEPATSGRPRVQGPRVHFKDGYDTEILAVTALRSQGVPGSRVPGSQGAFLKTAMTRRSWP